MIFAYQGSRVVVSDLIGMGKLGMYTYMNRDDQAYAMLDAARAARSLVESRGERFGQVALYGRSQDGGASAAAAEAQPADLDAVQSNIDGSDLVGAVPAYRRDHCR